jgi:hypothetical protein
MTGSDLEQGAAAMAGKPSRADLIWRSGFRPGPRLRRGFARTFWTLLATLGLAARVHNFATRRHP